MSDNLDKYAPEFDEEEARDKLAGATSAQLTDMLIYSYKLRRVIQKMHAVDTSKLREFKRS